SSFSFLRYFHRRVLPSFPTRRSADLRSPCPADRGSRVWASPHRRPVPCVLTLLCESLREFLPRSFEVYQERATVRLTVRTPKRAAGCGHRAEAQPRIWRNHLAAVTTNGAGRGAGPAGDPGGRRAGPAGEVGRQGSRAGRGAGPAGVCGERCRPECATGPDMSSGVEAHAHGVEDLEQPPTSALVLIGLDQGL